MSKYTYEDYIKNGCHPTGYNEACESYYFGQSTVDMLLDKIKALESRLANCIEPKFKIGQEIWETRPFMAWEVESIRFEKHNGILYECYHLGHKGTDHYNSCVIPSDNDRFFATKEEALKKLEEMGNE